jgi:hypothetical protein
VKSALRIFATILVLWAAPAFAQSGPVYSSGSAVNPGQVPWWLSNGIIGSGVTANDSPVNTFGITSNNLNSFCISTQRAAVGNRQQFCLGVTDTGPATISLQNYGSDASQGLSIVLNGIVYPFPGSLANITLGTTPVIGGSNGACLYVNGSVVGQQTCTLSAITSLTGDILATGPGAAAATLPTVNANVGTFGSTTAVPTITVNAKGQVTAASQVPVGLNIGTSGVANGTNGDLLYNNSGIVGNESIASILTAGSGITITGTTNATIACTTATSAVLGCVKPDGTIITVATGAITVAKATSAAFGVIEGDGSTITLTAGVASCTTATNSQLGCVKPDGTSITISGGVITSVATASSVTVGTTNVNSGVSGNCLYNNSGVLGNLACGSFVPAGRLTLVSGTPVMNANETAKATIYYDCFNGNTVPVYTGSTDLFLPIGSCEISTTMQASSTGVINNAGVFDVWAVNISSTLTLCVATNGSGGGWASDSGGSNTARGTGYSQLDKTTRPYVTNKNSIGNCYNGGTQEGTISANQATYLGTIYATANGQTGMNFKPAGAAGGAAPILGLYNGYNQVRLCGFNQDSQAHAYGTATWRAENASTSDRVSFVDGLQTATIDVSYATSVQSGASSSGGLIGANLDAATGAPDHFITFVNSGTLTGGLTSSEQFFPQIGFHFIQAMESAANSINVTFDLSGVESLKVCLSM